MAAQEGTTNSLVEHCRTLRGTTEDIKWGGDLVFSVGGSMYASFAIDDLDHYGFKTDEDDFASLTTIDGIRPAAYLARALWVTVDEPGLLSDDEARDLLTKSRSLVLARLPKRVQAELGG